MTETAENDPGCDSRGHENPPGEGQHDPDYLDAFITLSLT